MKRSKKPITSNQLLATSHRGYIAVVSSAILGSVGGSRTSLSMEKNRQAQALADACAEQALIKLKVSLTYPGNEILTFGSNQCKILPVEGIGNTNRTVKTIGTVDNLLRRNQIRIQTVNPNLVIFSWQEINNF